MNILDKIVLHKRKEVQARKEQFPEETFAPLDLYQRSCISLSKVLHQKSSLGIIAEFKRKSPSKGQIHKGLADVKEIAEGYLKAGASSMSVLTDQEFFGANEKDILYARAYSDLPILRKEFMIDPYQISEAKAMGADLILLIGAVLNKEQSKLLCDKAHDLGMEVLYEIHDESELNNMPHDIDIVGINNRDLKAFKVDFNHSIKLLSKLPQEKAKISESGISKPETIINLKKEGFNGFLIGETFMKTDDPSQACANFITNCKNLLNAH